MGHPDTEMATFLTNIMLNSMERDRLLHDVDCAAIIHQVAWATNRSERAHQLLERLRAHGMLEPENRHLLFAALRELRPYRQTDLEQLSALYDDGFTTDPDTQVPRTRPQRLVDQVAALRETRFFCHLALGALFVMLLQQCTGL